MPLNYYRLEAFVREQMGAARIPGLALSIVQGTEILYARGFGVTSVERGATDVTPETLFQIGSVTKPLTGTAIMRLVERGTLALDTPVTTYLPWLTLSEPGAAERVTLRLLLSHTAGLPHDHKPFGRRDPEALANRIRQDVPRYALVAPPGTLYSYSNTGMHVLAHVAETVCGRLYPQLMDELVFDPLQMRRTTFDPTVAMTYPIAQAHSLERAEDGAERLAVEHRFADNAAHYSSGQATSNVLDLANLAIAHLNEGRVGGTQFLSPESVRAMHAKHAETYGLADAGYGFTFSSRAYKGLRRVGHGGAIVGFGATFTLIPERRTGVIALFNHLGGAPAVEKIVNRVFDDLLDLPPHDAEPQPVGPDRSLWPRFTGHYLGNWSGLATVAEQDGHLVLDWISGELPLQALRRDLYFGQKPDGSARTAVGFVLADVPENGRSTGVQREGAPVHYLMLNGAPHRRIPFDPSVAPDPAALARFAGTYAGERHALAVRVEYGRLVVRNQRSGQEAPAVALSEGRFATRFGTLEFSADARDGSVRYGGFVRLTRSP